MANEQNLVNLATRTQREKTEIARKGQIASTETRRRKKQLKEELEILMETIAKDGRTYQELISTALVKEALKGNTKAYEIIRDTMGQKPIETQHIIDDRNEAYKELSLEELKKLAGE